MRSIPRHTEEIWEEKGKLSICGCSGENQAGSPYGVGWFNGLHDMIGARGGVMLASGARNTQSFGDCISQKYAEESQEGGGR